MLADGSSVAVASAAVAECLTGPSRPWRVIGVATGGWWCRHGEDVLVFTTDRYVGLPNSVVIGANGLLEAHVRPDDRIVVGDGFVECRTARWRIVRWWDPHVTADPVDVADVVESVATAAALVGFERLEPLMAPLRARDPASFVEEAGRWIGHGHGLTPAGDDALTGLVAGYHHVGDSVGDHAAGSLLERVRPPVLARAGRATTLLSTALLRHAFAGEVAAPMAALLRSITGRGELTAAITATAAVGHGSGRALAAGVVAGAAAASGVRP